MNTPQPAVPENPAGRLADAAKQLLDAAAELDSAALTEDSVLPGWQRAHVLAHVEGVARAMSRQLSYAVRNERVEFYDGGYEGRTQDIERRAQRPADEQVSALTEAVSEVIEAFAALPDDGWDARISYRDGTVRDGSLALWRELVIHASDLAAGPTPLDWDPDFCHYLLTFLQARIPEGTVLDIRPLDEQPRTLANAGQGAGRTVVVGGSLQDIATWLAGRTPLGEVSATEAGEPVDLPELLPWPAAVAAKA